MMNNELTVKRSSKVEDVIAQVKDMKKADAIQVLATKLISIKDGNVKLLNEQVTVNNKFNIGIEKISIFKEGIDLEATGAVLGKLNAVAINGDEYKFVTILKSKYTKSSTKINGVPVWIAEGKTKVEGGFDKEGKQLWMAQYHLNEDQKIQICKYVEQILAAKAQQ